MTISILIVLSKDFESSKVIESSHSAAKKQISLIKTCIPTQKKKIIINRKGSGKTSLKPTKNSLTLDLMIYDLLGSVILDIMFMGNKKGMNYCSKFSDGNQS
jgi:hypothetical protein